MCCPELTREKLAAAVFSRQLGYTRTAEAGDETAALRPRDSILVCTRLLLPLRMWYSSHLVHACCLSLFSLALLHAYVPVCTYTHQRAVGGPLTQSSFCREADCIIVSSLSLS